MNEIMNVILNCTNCNRVLLAVEFHLKAQLSFSLDYDLVMSDYDSASFMATKQRRYSEKWRATNLNFTYNNGDMKAI